jgi:ABC-2 type transport system permease protein
MAIPDSFAGERERHTLETLLASRLSDRAILIGKIVLPIAVGWGITLVVLALSLITYNLAYWQGTFVFFALPIGLGSVTISLMLALLTAGAGVLISLRAPSVQEAQQTLMSIILLPPVLLSVVLTMVVGSFSETLGGIVESIDFTQVVLIVDGVLFILSVVLFLAAQARFQRSRLYAG